MINDSKKLWMSIDNKINPEPVALGRYASEEYIQDPIHLGIVAARYKFCARMLHGFNNVLEVGCGDGFGSPIVASVVKQLTCTDINDPLIEDNKNRNIFLKNVTYEYFDFRDQYYPKKFNGIYLIDVIEHIYQQEEISFMNNILRSLSEYGTMIIGTPNKTAELYSSPCSREAHVNMKDYKELLYLAKQFFNNVFLFGMNDEVLHTGYPSMTHYLWVLCTSPRKKIK